MPTETNTLPSRTIRRVLAEFGFPVVRTIRQLHAGTGPSRKFVIKLDPSADEPRGDGSRGGGVSLLLKCHPKAGPIVESLILKHAVLRALAARGIPVAAPRTDRRNGTALVGERFVFELEDFIESQPWAPSVEAAAHAGEQLARLHTVSGDISDELRRQLRPASGLIAAQPSAERPAYPSADDGSEKGFLLGTIDDARRRVAPISGRLGEPRLIHGDFHPGNTRWADDALVCVLDFDSVRLGFPIEEVALASVHFSIDRGTKSMEARSPWPDTALFEGFWRGYLGTLQAGVQGIDREIASLAAWIAAGAIACEALSGVRGEAFGAETVSFAVGIAAWLVEHADGLGEIVARLADAQRPERG